MDVKFVETNKSINVGSITMPSILLPHQCAVYAYFNMYMISYSFIVSYPIESQFSESVNSFTRDVLYINRYGGCFPFYLHTKNSRLLYLICYA